MTVITTKRLVIRPSARDDAAINTMCKWLNNPDITRYSERRHKYHTHQTQFNYISVHLDTFREIYLGDELIGTINATEDEHNEVADVGIMIGDKSRWGQGYGLEAWAGYCDNLLNDGMRKIESGTMTHNLGMVHIFRKYGMYYEGRRQAHFLCGKETVDMVLWGKFRD